MRSPKKQLLLKSLSLFSVVRGYNILIIVIAQYLASAYIMAKGKPLRAILFDESLFVIVSSSALAIAAGYIINSFYDAEKDLINRPQKTMLDSLIDQRTKLYGYFSLNFLSVIAASYVSFRAVLFFSAYIFGIWLYSHKLKKMPLIGNLTSAVLAITPFFAVFVYYKNFDTVIFVHATFLFLLILIREFVKDLENIEGDLVQNYKTIPVLYGEKTSKKLILLSVGLTFIPAYLLITQFDIGYMYYYFYQSIILLLLFLLLLWKANRKPQYIRLHNILKFIIVSGVFGILLIDIHVILNRIL
ncbi:MAG: geranylgeranylglycerol-phosphate geranylgeranyltransferase [Bacteroidota bacterium]